MYPEVGIKCQYERVRALKPHRDKIYNDPRWTKISIRIRVETDFSILSILMVHVMVLWEVGRKKTVEKNKYM